VVPARPYLPRDFRLSERRRIEARGHEEKVLARSLTPPGPQSALGLSGRKLASEQEPGHLRAEVADIRARALGEEELHPVAGLEIGEFLEFDPFPELSESRVPAFRRESEFRERLAAPLPPGDTDYPEFVEHGRGA